MTLRDASRKNWSVRSPCPTESELNVGSLQRIADAAEAMQRSLAEISGNTREILLVARRADRRAAKRTP